MQRSSLALALAVVPALVGFTGNVGSETEISAGVGIGSYYSAYDTDADPHGEVSGAFRHKFKHFPYDDRAMWFQVGASWMTFPQGGDVGNQLLALSALVGGTDSWGEWGLGFVLYGDLSGIAPMLPLPAGHVRVGPEERLQFGFGAFDEVPLWKAGGMLHWEAIISVPFDKTWAPRVTVGARLDAYGMLDNRFPLGLYLGVEPRLGKHVRIGVFGSVGAGDGLRPSWQVSARTTVAFGPGTTSDRKPVGPD